MPKLEPKICVSSFYTLRLRFDRSFSCPDLRLLSTERSKNPALVAEDVIQGGEEDELLTNIGPSGKRIGMESRFYNLGGEGKFPFPRVVSKK